MSATFTSGTGGNPTTATAFIGPTVQVTLAAGQKIFMTANKALGSTAGATGLGLHACYQSTVAGSPIQQIGGGILGQQVPANTRVTFGINADFSAVPGTYNVGMCGASANAVNWNSNEYGYVTAIVHN